MGQQNEVNDFWKVGLTLGSGALLVVSLMYVTIPMMSLLTNEFHSSLEETLWAGSAFGLAYALGNVFFGVFSDRFHRKTILGFGILALSLSTVSISWSPSLTWLIALRAIQGLVAASFPTVALAYIGDVLAIRYRPVAVSILSTSFLLSGIVGQLIAQAIGDWLGWRALFKLLAIGYLLIAIFIYRLPSGVLPRTRLSLHQVYQRSIKLFTVPSLLVSLAVSATVLFSFVTMYAGLGSYVMKHFDLHEEALLWIRMAGIPGILMSLFAGIFMNRFGAKRVFIAGLATAGAALGIVGFSESLVVLVVASVFFVTGISIANPSIITIIGKYGGESRGTALAFNVLFAFVGASIGPLLAGNVHSFPVLCVGLMMILFVAVITAWLRIDESKQFTENGKAVSIRP
ncbi:MAG TPA: MFS transporter [Candidatus Bathyarchaeia archaeon]|nr:MFS transporter [Candidatus Bathyarchaeia archaeon]